MPKDAKKFYCKHCDFTCSKESNWKQHIITVKHMKNDILVTNDDNKMPKNANYTCKCGNTYMYRQGLSRHKKICSIVQGTVNDTNYTKIPHFEKDKQTIEIDKETIMAITPTIAQ